MVVSSIFISLHFHSKMVLIAESCIFNDLMLCFSIKLTKLRLFLLLLVMPVFMTVQKFYIFLNKFTCFSFPPPKSYKDAFCILQEEYADLYIKRRKLFSLGRQQCVLQYNGSFAILLILFIRTRGYVY